MTVDFVPTREPLPVHLYGVRAGHRRRSYLAALLLFIGCLIVLGLALFILVPPLLPLIPKDLYGFLPLLVIICLLLPVLAVARVVHQQAPMDLIAPGRRLDIGMALRSALVFAIPLLAQVVWSMGTGELVPASVGMGTFLLWMPFVVIGFVLQASTEEIIFRGYLAQGLRVVCRNTPAMVLISSVLFTLAHEGGDQQAVWAARAQIFVTALFLSWLTIRLGRLEASMGVHIVNNILFIWFIGAEQITLPGLFRSLDPDPPDFAGWMDILTFVGIHGASIGFYWLVGLRTGFVERGWSRRPSARAQQA